MSDPIRILLADDDELARDTLQSLLNSLGHDVVGAFGSGRAAVEQAGALHPDVVLLDVHMPDGNGVEAAEAIALAAPGTAVVLFSGDADLRLSDRDIDATAAVAYLAKPTAPASLDATLRMAAARSRALRRARDDADSARRQLEDRKLIERAKGILMRRTGATEQEAWSIIRRSSQDRSVAMAEIARAVLSSEKQ